MKIPKIMHARHWSLCPFWADYKKRRYLRSACSRMCDTYTGEIRTPAIASAFPDIKVNCKACLKQEKEHYKK